MIRERERKGKGGEVAFNEKNNYLYLYQNN